MNDYAHYHEYFHTSDGITITMCDYKIKAIKWKD